MKSHVRDFESFCKCIFIDAFAKCNADSVSMTRDLMKIRERVKHEGLSFLTITLPNFGLDFEESLRLNKVTPKVFSGWRKHSSLPAFLQGLTGLVFDAETGWLLDRPDIAAIEGIRQIAYTFKKVALPCTPEREYKALSGYKEIEHELSGATFPRDFDSFRRISNILWGDCFGYHFDSLDYYPKHGPGQTAERTSGNKKFAQRYWYERLEPFFPADSFIMSCFDQLDDELDGINNVQFVTRDDELPVKVTLVPKTLKGPRIIAMEPVCMQYAQQALSGYIVPRLESFWLTRGHVNFTDQSVNQRLAMSSSSDGSLATLDLSSASDRVPLSLVSVMLETNPDLRDAILACRSEKAQMPDGEVIHLQKFASMGSALCFPIESMYFFTIVLLALLKKQELPVTLRNIHSVSRNVYIYGDDIIIPTDAAVIVSETLTEFYCRVNSNKSFWTGKFRESCGMDAYDGECVTPTYLRQLQPRDKDSASEVISWVETCNLFYKRGYWTTAAYMKSIVESVVGNLPVIQENSPGLGWTSFQKFISVERWNTALHRFEVKTYVPSPVYRKDTLGGWSALLKFFLREKVPPFTSEKSHRENIHGRFRVFSSDEKHLSRSPRSGTSCIKRRWTTPY